MTDDTAALIVELGILHDAPCGCPCAVSLDPDSGDIGHVTGHYPQSRKLDMNHVEEWTEHTKGCTCAAYDDVPHLEHLPLCPLFEPAFDLKIVGKDNVLNYIGYAGDVFKA